MATTGKAIHKPQRGGWTGRFPEGGDAHRGLVFRPLSPEKRCWADGGTSTQRRRPSNLPAQQRDDPVHSNNKNMRAPSLPGLRMRIIALLWRVGEEAFAEIDAFAWVQRWEIRRTWHTHIYRDTRF